MRTWKAVSPHTWTSPPLYERNLIVVWFAIHNEHGNYLLYVDSIFGLDQNRGYLIAEAPTLEGAKFAAEMLGTPEEEWGRRKPA